MIHMAKFSEDNNYQNWRQYIELQHWPINKRRTGNFSWYCKWRKRTVSPEALMNQMLLWKPINNRQEQHTSLCKASSSSCLSSGVMSLAYNWVRQLRILKSQQKTYGLEWKHKTISSQLSINRLHDETDQETDQG